MGPLWLNGTQIHGRCYKNRMRSFLSLMMASAILISGFALVAGEVIRPQGIRPFLLVGAVLKATKGSPR